MNPKLLLLPLLALSATAAQAHTGDHGAGFAAGFGHPLGGLDHVLAMVAVGLWAAQSGGRRLWAVPAVFLAALAAGALGAAAGLALPLAEPGSVGSVLVLGALVALGARLPAWAGLTLVAAFALCHGHAHGAGLPAGGGLVYGLGFMAASLLLHIAGALPVLAARLPGWLTRAGGAAIAAAGLALGAGL